MSRRCGRWAVLVLLVATSLGFSAEPAAAWAHNGAYWGPIPAVATYRLFDLLGGSGPNNRYHTYVQEAIETWNYTLDGRMTFVEAGADTPVKEVDVKVWSSDDGHNGVVGVFHGVTYGGGIMGPGSQLWINRWEADAILGLKEPWMADPPLLRTAFLHEVGHGIGLGHAALNRPFDAATRTTPSACNIMFDILNPFGNTYNPPAECAGRGGYLKVDDIEGAWARYPPPTPPNVTPPKLGDYIPSDLCTGDWLC